jgi:hypothetical protein
MTISIRLAHLGDLTRLVMFGRRAHADSNYSDIPFNADITRNMFRGGVVMKGQDVLIAERADGSLCGFLICLSVPLPFSRRRYATDGAFYAEQGGDKLLSAFVAWAKTHHVARIDMGVTQDDPKGRLSRLYSRKGFQPTGGMYLMKLERES